MKLNTEDGDLSKDINHFQRLMVKLIYLTAIRSDVSSVASHI
jgi:hypothetical protein